MGKDLHLINIYLKIHNKQTLTMDDLRYLAQYSPECFQKTCKNVVYNIPETKHVMEPDEQPKEPETTVSSQTEDVSTQKAKEEEHNIQNILHKIKKMEANKMPVPNVKADEVKNLLGNLYMEMLFPHNDRDMSFYVMNDEERSSFDRKA